MKFANVIYLLAGAVIAVLVMVIIPNEELPEDTDSTRMDENAAQQASRDNSGESIAAAEQPTSPFSSADAVDPTQDDRSTDEAKRIRDMMDRVFTGKATHEEALAFWEELRSSDEINDIIAQQENNTPLDSDDIQSHMNLAQLYIAKLYSSSVGPEMGLWAGKAEERWRAVLQLEPEHRDAQHSLAFSLSQYPDFMNKTGEAINEYEKVVAIQRDMDPSPGQVNVYLELFRLYQKRGDQANAYDTIQEGLERFPDNQELIDQRNSLSVIQ